MSLDLTPIEIIWSWVAERQSHHPSPANAVDEKFSVRGELHVLIATSRKRPTKFFFYKGENASQAAEIVNGAYGADTVTANYVQVWFRRFCSGIFDVKDVPGTGRSIVENVDKITEIIEVEPHVSSRSIAQELKIGHKTVLSHLRKVGFKKKLEFGAIPINTKKHDGSNFHTKPWLNGMNRSIS
ncbi:histone-lysine N-methyltransferase SETMAR [Trichonephila clavipes]|nr:histone-lysine N-methyltransferase SETMAR [Trichonephila clavipes]